MEVRQGYKQTEVGMIPEDWELRSLLTTVCIASGQVDPKIEPYKSMILVAPDHIESSTGRLLSQRTALDQGAISGKYLFERVTSFIARYVRIYGRLLLQALTGCAARTCIHSSPPAMFVLGSCWLSFLGVAFQSTPNLFRFVAECQRLTEQSWQSL